MSMLTLYLNFEKIPTVFDSLEQSSLIWFFQVRFESKITPRYLTVETCLILTPSIFKLSNLLGFNFLEWKRTKFAFKILSANLLDFIHSATILSSLFSFDCWEYWKRIAVKRWDSAPFLWYFCSTLVLFLILISRMYFWGLNHLESTV